MSHSEDATAILLLCIIFVSGIASGLLVYQYMPFQEDDPEDIPAVPLTGTVTASMSMYPTIHTGMNYEYELVDNETEILCGHPYVYISNRDGDRIIHTMIYETEDGQYLFKGDNNQYPDQEVVNRSQILKKVNGMWYK